MRLVVISGRSGSGKSSALHVLEDVGFYCIDNLPIMLLPELIQEARSSNRLNRVAVSIDARNLSQTDAEVGELLQSIAQDQHQLEVIYLDADDSVLLQRYSATRRRHPLTTETVSLAEAIQQEIKLLEPLANMSDLTLDTTHMSVHDLRGLIRLRVAKKDSTSMSILFESFGFKHGIPTDADYVFDVRHLPNPYWEESLRSYTGLDQPVQDFLGSSAQVGKMHDSIAQFMDQWLPDFIGANRSYMTIAIGCTGGQHRSVYLTERLAKTFKQKYGSVQIRHRQLPSTN